jgi:hypothetical protein
LLEWHLVINIGVLQVTMILTFSNADGHAPPRRSQASFGSLSSSTQSPFWQPPGVSPAAELFLDAIDQPQKEITLSTHDLKDSTVAIHGGRTLDSHASSILFPLYQTSTFVHDAVGVDKGFSYSRVSNPTVDALEKAIGALEGTPPAVCFPHRHGSD